MAEESEPTLSFAEKRIARLMAEMDDVRAQLPGIIQSIDTARQHGDLSENADYHAAREEQKHAYARLRNLQNEINAVRSEKPLSKAEKSLVGLVVAYFDEDLGVTKVVMFTDDEPDPRNCIVSIRSPLGQGFSEAAERNDDLLEVGARVRFYMPSGRVETSSKSNVADEDLIHSRTVTVTGIQRALKSNPVRSNPTVDRVVVLHAAELREKLSPKKLAAYREALRDLMDGFGSPQLKIMYRSFSHENLERLLHLLADVR